MSTQLLTELKTENSSECRVPMNELGGHIESILLVAGDGVSVAYLAEKFGIKAKDVECVMSELQKRYSGECGVHLIKYRDNWQFSTNPKFADKVAEIMNPIRERNLTRAALETLAIIAYKQPITKVEIEEIRGSDASYALQILTQNNMVEVVGRKDTVGKPLLYATTDDFLKRFELESIDKLPSYEELLEKIRVIQTTGDGIYDRAS